MSDLVAQRIIEMLQNQNGMAEIRRNELAEDMGCVPSQINYVITSRFTPEHGYIVESRRGGGGYIRITRVKVDRNTAIMHLVNSIGQSLDFPTARAIIGNLSEQEIIGKDTAAAMLAAMNDICYRGLPPEIRNEIRANILKQMLIV
jgi:transcriptional regulator CtsR